MSRLNGRVRKLEAEARPEKVAVAIAGDVVWDVVRCEEYKGGMANVVVIARVAADIWRLL